MRRRYGRPRLPTAPDTDSHSEQREQHRGWSCNLEIGDTDRFTVGSGVGQDAEDDRSDAKSGANERTTLDRASEWEPTRHLGADDIGLRNRDQGLALLHAHDDTVVLNANYPTGEGVRMRRLDTNATIDDSRWYDLRVNLRTRQHEERETGKAIDLSNATEEWH